MIGITPQDTVYLKLLTLAINAYLQMNDNRGRTDPIMRGGAGMLEAGLALMSVPLDDDMLTVFRDLPIGAKYYYGRHEAMIMLPEIHAYQVNPTVN